MTRCVKGASAASPRTERHRMRPQTVSHLDPAERLAGLQLDEEASKRCSCRLYPAGTLVPDEGCPEHPDAVSTFSADE